LVPTQTIGSVILLLQQSFHSKALRSGDRFVSPPHPGVRDARRIEIRFFDDDNDFVVVVMQRFYGLIIFKIHI
jgi:hypothetical protein